MSLFDQLVDEALRSQEELHLLRPVVEKELLHHDIFRELSGAGMLSGLTFIGGTCLRACYGSSRLSEDLDFTGGANFRREDLAELGEILVDRLQVRYGLPVRVSDPVKESGKVSTWKMAIETRPVQRHLPAQRIHLEICAIPSHYRKPMMLRNIYGVEMGTSGLIIQAESREEILADKLIAFAFRESRIKNRDLWDMAWLVQSGILLPKDLIPIKVADHEREWSEVVERLEERRISLKEKPEMRTDFVKEMSRFLPSAVVSETIEQEAYWQYLTSVVDELVRVGIG